MLERIAGKLMSLFFVNEISCLFLPLRYIVVQGRRVAAHVYNKKVLAAARMIRGLYYRWHSRRLRLRTNLNFLNRGVVLLQSYFRMRAAIQFSNVILRLLHNKRKLRIQ